MSQCTESVDVAVDVAVDVVPRTRFAHGAIDQWLHRFCAPAERAEIAAVAEPARQPFAAAMWAAKECGVKLAGRRPETGFGAIVVSLNDRIPHPQLKQRLADVIGDIAVSLEPQQSHSPAFGKVSGVDGGEASLAVLSTDTYAVAVAARPRQIGPVR